jgi:N-acetylneuraminic acid mutarotase
LALPFLNSCEDSSEDLIGNWKELSSFDGNARTDAVGFAIGSKGYLGTGYDGDDRLNDFWEYDPRRDTWTQLENFPGAPRNGAIGFGTDTKGYIGTGRDGTTNMFKDFYEYDPATNKWTRKEDFGGSARYGAVAMSINNKGYVGTGYDENYLKDFWQYNPDDDNWTQVTSYGGSKRMNAASFVIDGKGYVVTGTANSNYPDDFYVYDPDLDKWDKLREISNRSSYDYDDDYDTDPIVGTSRAGFAINGKGYVATGGQTSGTYTWEYDPSTDLWVERYPFEGNAKSRAVGFAIGSLGYVVTGLSSSSYTEDLWSFDPKVIYNKYDK